MLPAMLYLVIDMTKKCSIQLKLIFASESSLSAADE